jgi:hypothetical protein
VLQGAHVVYLGESLVSRSGKTLRSEDERKFTKVGGAELMKARRPDGSRIKTPTHTRFSKLHTRDGRSTLAIRESY